MSHFSTELRTVRLRAAGVACLPGCENEAHVGGLTGEDPFAECRVTLPAGEVKGPRGERVEVAVNVVRLGATVTATIDVTSFAAHDRPCAGADLTDVDALALALVLTHAAELSQGATGFSETN